MRRAYAMTLFAFAACTGEIVTNDTGQQVGGIVTNGESLNGESLNGSGLGNSVAWASFANVKNGNIHFDDMWIEGSELVARKKFGKARGIYRGAALQGAVVQARSDIDRHVALRVSKVVPPDPGDDKWQYGIEFQFQGSWFPLCLADALTGEGLNGPSLNGDELNQGIEDGSILSLDAVPVNGYWNYQQGVDGGGDKTRTLDRFTFACPVIGAIGKCIDAGYKPWTSLENEHESCVRLMRADYCGDGTPHTVSGTMINLYDQLGVQDDTENWPLEAEWDADGARCVTGHLRHATAVACYDRLYEPDCGDPADWAGGTLLVSELP